MTERRPPSWSEEGEPLGEMVEHTRRKLRPRSPRPASWWTGLVWLEAQARRNSPEQPCAGADHWRRGVGGSRVGQRMDEGPGGLVGCSR